MLVGFSFRAKPGKTAELESLLDDPDAGRRIAAAIGAQRNVVFWQGDRMVRIFEFRDDAVPVPLAKVAEAQPAVKEFLRKVGELAEPGFDLDRPETFEAFNRACVLRLVYDVRT